MADGPGEDLDALVRRVDPDRWLSSRFIPDAETRADVVALYAFDYELRRAVEATTNPIMAEIRLTWWGEALDEIYAGGQVRRHPVVEALAQAAARRDVPRRLLDQAIEARLARAPDGSVAEAAAGALDPEVDVAAVRVLGAAWERQAADAAVRAAARRVSAAAFPSVAPVALIGGPRPELARKMRLTWAVLRGRV